ncbi:MAG: hypothetical protein GF411_08795 [Candidatus Lokiarchaeota archaeon]|nr:hypothetical protein [Candidatus Lokiarchaeota archaeon]
MNFVDTDICKSRANCELCRNDDKFIKTMNKKYGSFECPLGIKMGTSIADMPDEVRTSVIHSKKLREDMAQKRQDVSNALDELELIVPGDALTYVDIIRDFIFPNMKRPKDCIHSKSMMGKVKETCCGGKIEETDAFSCAIHHITTARKCNKCKDFKRRR